MEYLLNFPDAPYAGESWQRYFDYTFVDARLVQSGFIRFDLCFFLG